MVKTMKLKQLLNDDQAVSPVIGVILMVAITVILAAVIGTFVLGLGDQVSQTTPSASFQFDYDAGGNESVTIAHNGGDTLSSSEVNVTVSGANKTDANGQYTWTDLGGSSGDVGAGSTATVHGGHVDSNGAIDLSEATVRVVWQAAEGDSSAQLGTWSGPDA
jgi:flagellin-like protein